MSLLNNSCFDDIQCDVILCWTFCSYYQVNTIYLNIFIRCASCDVIARWWRVCLLAAREQAADGGDAALRAGERQPGTRARHQQDRAAQRPRHGESRSRM